MPLSRNHTSAPAQTYFRVCPDILPGLGRHSINYGAVFINYGAVYKNYGAVCKNYGVVCKNRAVVLRIDAGNRKNTAASGEIRTSIFEGLDEEKGFFPNFATKTS